MSACDECRNDFDAMSRLVESLPDDMKTSNCVLNAKMLLVAFAYQKAEKENAKLRELLQRTWDAFHDATAREFVDVKNELRDLGVEVDDGSR